MGRVVLAGIVPMLVVIAFAARGWLNLDHAVMLGGLVLLTFAPAYLFADFVVSLLRASGDEDVAAAH